MTKTSFAPNWGSPPGDALSDLLEERGITQKELSIKLGRSDKNLSQIVNGKAPITSDFAIDLERVLGTPAHFWNSREARYREWISRQNITEPTEDDLGWARSFPYPSMVKNGWIAAAANVREKFFNLLKFFGVVDRAAFVAWQATLSPMYRRAVASTEKDNLIAAWLRRGEIEAATVKTGAYSEGGFEAAISEARKLTRQDPETFDPQLKKLYAEAGVALLFVCELPSMGVAGATRWLGSKPVIQITLRYKTNDQFWFTIFHESCHILKHQKRVVFLETVKGAYSVEEAEANEFAADLLIPPRAYRMFIERKIFTSESVLEFAASVEICPGVVVGRLQRERHIHFGALNSLKVPLKWSVGK